ncbi:hypothetical protein LTR10_004887 [Elasticomyces elasticus]|nr:hypothetical protein LTR10_004887 [Elasticomyces elasticus]KAK4977201.1 hypothetical protein LTR42_003249 [Elasticomyces elasticus]
MAIPTNFHSTAASKVFNTPELLEIILLDTIVTQSDPTTSARAYMKEHCRSLVALLGCQRVSKTFNATINDTPSLRRALFFADSDYTPMAGVTGNATLNPLIHDRQYCKGLSGGTVIVEWDLSNPKATPNMLVRVQGAKGRRTKRRCQGRCLVRGGSWQKMLLTSRPVQVMVHQVGGGLRGGRELSTGAKVAGALGNFVIAELPADESDSE